MAGKNTFKRGPHPSSLPEIPYYVPPLSASTRDTLGEALGRELTASEQQIVEENLAACRALREYELSNFSTLEDVKRTLAALVKAAPVEALRGFHDCDERTRMYVTKSVYALDIRDASELASPDAALIKLGASHALRRLQSQHGRRGRPSKSYQLAIATFAVSSWTDFGQTDLKIWFCIREGVTHRSRLHQWTTAMVCHVDGSSTDSQVNAVLRRALDHKPEAGGF